MVSPKSRTSGGGTKKDMTKTQRLGMISGGIIKKGILVGGDENDEGLGKWNGCVG